MVFRKKVKSSAFTIRSLLYHLEIHYFWKRSLYVITIIRIDRFEALLTSFSNTVLGMTKKYRVSISFIFRLDIWLQQKANIKFREINDIFKREKTP